MRLIAAELEGTTVIEFPVPAHIHVITGLPDATRFHTARLLARAVAGQDVDAHLEVSIDDHQLTLTSELSSALLSTIGTRDCLIRRGDLFAPGTDGAALESDQELTEIDREFDELRTRRAALQAALVPEDELDLGAVSQMLERVKALPASSGIPSRDGRALADELSALRRSRVERVDALFPVAEARLAEAHDSLVAEEQRQGKWVSSWLIEQINEAEAEREKTERKATRKLSGPQAYERYLAACDHLAELLAQIGVSDWAEFEMLVQEGNNEQAQRKRLNTKKGAVSAVERMIEQLRAGQGNDPVLQNLNRDEAELRTRATALLGRGVDDDVALDSQLRARQEPTPGRDGALSALASELDRLGVTPGDQPSTVAEDLVRDRTAAAAQQGTIGQELASSKEQASMLKVRRTVLLERVAHEHDEPSVDPAALGNPAPVLLRLMALLKSHRDVAVVGDLPVIFDDPFRDIPDATVIRVLEALHDAAESLQLVFLTDDERVVRWAEDLGPQVGRRGVTQLVS